MGISSWLKYLRLFSLGTVFARNVANWLDRVTSEGSEGGEKITTGEWVSLAGVIAQSIEEATGELVNVSVEPKLKTGR